MLPALVVGNAPVKVMAVIAVDGVTLDHGESAGGVKVGDKCLGIRCGAIIGGIGCCDHNACVIVQGDVGGGAYLGMIWLWLQGGRFGREKKRWT